MMDMTELEDVINSEYEEEEKEEETIQGPGGRAADGGAEERAAEAGAGAEASNDGSSSQAQEDAPPVEKFDNVRGVRSSAERSYFSVRFHLWHTYKVDKPRLPNDEDDPNVLTWDRKHFPAVLADVRLVGREMQQTVEVLQELVDTIRLRNLVISGPPSSGKTMMVEVFLRQFFAHVEATAPAPTSKRKTLRRRQAPDAIYRISQSDTIQMSGLERKIGEWVDEINKFPDIEHRVVFLDGLCKVTPNNQQWLFRIMDKYEITGKPPRRLHFMFTCFDHTRIIHKLKMRTQLLKVDAMPWLESLEVLAQACQKERLGYEIKGLELVVQRVGTHLGHLLNVLQEIFYKHKYVSLINAGKRIAPDMIGAWKRSGMRFFEFKLLGDTTQYRSPWSNQFPNIKLVTMEGHTTPAKFLIGFNKTGHALEVARQQAAAQRSRRVLEPPPQTSTTALNHTEDGRTTTLDSRPSTPQRPPSGRSTPQLVDGSGGGRANTSTRLMTGATTGSRPSTANHSRPSTPAGPTDEELAQRRRIESELVDGPWLSVRHKSNRFDVRRIDFALKRKGHNEWVFVEYLVMESLLYDPSSRRSGLAVVLQERPLIRLNDLMSFNEQITKVFAPDARVRNPKHDGRFIPSKQLETIDLSRPAFNFAVEGRPKSGINDSGKDKPVRRFNAQRTRWCSLGLHEVFNGRQCWRILIKGNPTWEGFGNPAQGGFER